ncbi:MAG: PmoA family protein [Planctomycetota bacterium]|nr:PmoA family protein [Planctomycetota bacterium]
MLVFLSRFRFNTLRSAVSATKNAIALAIMASALSIQSFSQEFQAKRELDRVDLMQAGKLITSYHFKSGTKPILWPLMGPDNLRMSREYPMVPDSTNEAHDHPHHRSLWMTFGEVNDVDFWAEGKNHGEVVHSEIVNTAQSSTSASVEARHIWQTLDAKPFLQEHCKYTVSGTPDERIIDCEYILKHVDPASKEPIHFGDTKEGMFAIRVPETMKVDKASGHILNSSGLTDGKTWGKPADWVDYAGKATIDAKQEHGIAILIHPQSFGRTGYWHVRTYGLFAHNPIGVKHFLEVNPDATKKEGGYMLQPGQSMHMLYRVVLHRNAWTQTVGDEHYQVFAKTSPQLK